jgi:hypothetical protein
MAGSVARTRRPNGSKAAPARSVRVTDETWERAKRRATYDGVTISHVAALLIEGYAQGVIDPPRTVFTPTRQPSGAE